MPGSRQPVAVLEAKGKKHLTKAEAAQRQAQEVRLPPPKTAKPPKWLPDALKKDFRALGKKLIAAGLYTELDADTLGRYLIAAQQWFKATVEADNALDEKDAEAAQEWSVIQDRYFKQARNCANDMGLTVTSRCRLVIPDALKPDSQDVGNPFLALIQGGRKDA